MAEKRTICVMARGADQDDGQGVYNRSLLRELFVLDPQTTWVVLLTTDKCVDMFSGFPNVIVKVVPTRFKLYWDQVVVPKIAREHNADLIFNPKFSIPIFTRIPCLFVLHGSDWYINPRNYTWWDNLYIRLMMPIYCRKAAELLSISATIAKDLEKYAGLDPSKVTVSHAAPNDNFKLCHDPDVLRTFREKHGLPDKFILTVLRVQHNVYKGSAPYPGGNSEGVMRAYQRYRQQGGSLPMVAVGHRIREYLIEQGFTDSDLADVIFTGLMPHDEIQHAYQAAEYFIQATLYESFGLRIVEAFACGCPSVLPATGAAPEIAGGAARLVDPLNVDEMANALKELEEKPALRQLLREKGLLRAQEFTWRRTAEKTLSTIDSILREQAQGSVAVETF
jgi:glycosyltransferase involved in cell wall biosynthesis